MNEAGYSPVSACSGMLNIRTVLQLLYHAVNDFKNRKIIGLTHVCIHSVYIHH